MSSEGQQTTPGGERRIEQEPEQRREWSVARARSTAGTSGWLAFGGWMLLLAGAFNIIAGLAALFRPDYYVVVAGELLVFDFAVWGWVWLAAGVLQAATGAGCLGGQRWARITGVGLAGLAAIGHLAFLAAFPLWELASIALSVLVIYALVVPGKDAVG